MGERIGCALVSRSTGEDLTGTASFVRRWLLIEQPGPWGADALVESRMDTEVSAALRRLGRDLRIRILLIRRPGRDRQLSPRTAFAALTTRTERRLERLTFTDPRELLAYDWRGFAAGGPCGGHPEDGPVFLVCTNGRHDACCAELGRPLATALAAVEPDTTWESSHFGGDRFAANVVCLPDGTYYGRVPATAARGLARATRAGKLSLEHLRGRSALPFPVQAAEIAVRRATGLDGVDDLTVTARVRTSDDSSEVTLAETSGREHTVTVTVRREDTARPLSCGAEPIVPPRYDTRVHAAT